MTDDRDHEQQSVEDDKDQTAEKGLETRSSNDDHSDLGDEPDVNNHHAIPRHSFDSWPGKSDQHGQSVPNPNGQS